MLAVSGVGFVLCVKIDEKAGKRADNSNGNSVVCTSENIPCLNSKAAAKASSMSVPNSRVLTGSQFITAPVLAAFAKILLPTLLSSAMDIEGDVIWGNPDG